MIKYEDLKVDYRIKNIEDIVVDHIVVSAGTEWRVIKLGHLMEDSSNPGIYPEVKYIRLSHFVNENISIVIDVFNVDNRPYRVEHFIHE